MKTANRGPFNVNTKLDEQEIATTYGLYSKELLEPTLASNNLLNKHRVYTAGDGMQDVKFHDLWAVTRASTKTFVGPNGLITEAAANLLPVSYDPVTLKPVGRIVEEARTNLAFPSERYVIGAATITNDAINLGDLKLSLYVEDGTSNNRFNTLGQSVTGTYTATTRVKPLSGSTQRYLQVRCTSPLVGAVFNPNTGEVTAASSGVVTHVKKLIDGCWEFSATFNADNATIVSGLHSSSGNLTGGSYTGDGVSGMHMGGAQLEQGATPSSYIPTTTAQVTRAADDVVRTLGSEFNQNEFTLFVEGSLPQTGFRRLTYLSGPDTAGGGNDLSLGVTNGDSAWYLSVFSNGSQQAPFVTAPWQSDVINKWALSFKDGEYICYRDGVLHQQFTGEAPVGLDSFKIHTKVGSISSARNVDTRYFPYALTATELQELTK